MESIFRIKINVGTGMHCRHDHLSQELVSPGLKNPSYTWVLQ